MACCLFALEDILHIIWLYHTHFMLLQATGNPDLVVDEETNNLALLEVQKHLQAQDKSLDQYGMPMPHATQEAAPAFPTEMEALERNYDAAKLTQVVQERLQLIQGNDGQKAVWAAVKAALEKPVADGVTLSPCAVTALITALLTQQLPVCCPIATMKSQMGLPDATLLARLA